MRGNKGFDRSDRNLAMLGHELCSVLNGIQGMTELLGGTRLNGEQQQFVEAVKLSIRQMHWLIGGISSGRRGRKFPLPPAHRALDGPELLEQVIRCHSRAATMKNNLLLLTVDPKLPQRWFSDVRLLRQIIDNLLSNAIKFTQSGQVVLEARCQPAGQNSDTGLELLVRDTGIGFNQAEAQRIFKPFVQAGPGIGQAHGGTGLGLYICRKFVSRLRGQLDCSSQPGSGSCFRVFLPDAIEPGQLGERDLNSCLLSSLTCQLSIQAELGRSVESLLTRMGIMIEPRGVGEKPFAKDGLLVEISSVDPCSKEAALNHGLLLTPRPVPTSRGSLPGARRIQPPFLASTLGPLLMEMALEWRLRPD